MDVVEMPGMRSTEKRDYKEAPQWTFKKTPLVAFHGHIRMQLRQPKSVCCSNPSVICSVHTCGSTRQLVDVMETTNIKWLYSHTALYTTPLTK